MAIDQQSNELVRVCVCVCVCVCRTISETLSSLLPHECFSIQPEALSTLFNLTMKLDTKAGTRERWTLCRPCANSLQCRIYFKNEKILLFIFLF